MPAEPDRPGSGGHRRPFAVVTGASSGIGFELARELTERGYDLLLAAEDDGIVGAAQRLVSTQRWIEPIKVDLTRPGDVDRLVERIDAIDRPVDVLAVNAGVGAGGPFVGRADVPEGLAEQLAIVDLNVRSAVHLTKLVLPGMVEHGGRVLFTSSVAATTPGPFQAVYHASKAFLQSFAQALREELRGSGITVTTLMPGPTDTRFFDRAGLLDTRIGAGPKDSAAEVAKQGVDALLAGKDHVVAGSMKNRIQALAGRVLPDTVLTAAYRKLSAPGSAKR